MRFCLTVYLFLVSGCAGYTLKTSPVDAPSVCFWKRAHVEIQHYPGEMRASDMGPRYTADDLLMALLAGLGRTESALPGLVFSSHPDPKYQQVLSGALARACSLPVSDSNCDHIVALTEALVVKTARIRTADALTVGILSRVAEDAKCPLREATSTTYRELWSLRGENARIHAVKGLAAARTAESLDVVRRIARAPCLAFQRTTLGEKDDVSTQDGTGQVYDLSLAPEHILGSHLYTHSRLDLSCYARSALETLKKENAGRKE